MGSKSIQNSDTKSVKLIAMPIALTQPNAVSKMEKKEVLGLILGIYIRCGTVVTDFDWEAKTR